MVELCGIAGIISKSHSTSIIPNLLSILSNLTNRGKDGTGIGYIDQTGKVVINKNKTSVNKFVEKYIKETVVCNIAIGHVRQSTIGIISESNSHPIAGCNNKIAVIHNGTIKNWSPLQEELENEGHKFRGSVDSEVIPHLIEKYFEKYANLEDSIRKTINRLEGYYTFSVISNFEPNNVYLYRHHFPLVLLKDENTFYFSTERRSLAKFLQKPFRVKNLKKNKLTILSLDSFES
ncbi:MAG: class II glutamine amidotransferase [Promethearchaeota archaeon]